MENKRCSKCKEIKNVEKFSKNQCCCKKCQKQYIEENKNEIRKRKKEYRQKNKEKIAKSKKNFYNDNKISILNQKKEYYNRNREDILKKREDCRKNNKEKCLFDSARRRAKKRGEIFNITVKDIKTVMPKDNICPLLNIKMETNINNAKYNSFTLDQINPKENYNSNNIWVISRKANTSKNNATIEEYEKIVNNLNNIIEGNRKILCGNYNVDNIIKSAFYEAKKRSKKKNIPFNITKEYLRSIYPKNNKCPLLEVSMFKGVGRFIENSPSLDKTINYKGYIEGNLMWTSSRANRIKNDLTLNEMNLLLKNWKKKLKEMNKIE